MPRKRKPPRDDPDESERFIAVAREIEADPTGALFEREFVSIARKPADTKAKTKKARR